MKEVMGHCVKGKTHWGLYLPLKQLNTLCLCDSKWLQESCLLKIITDELHLLFTNKTSMQNKVLIDFIADLSL